MNEAVKTGGDLCVCGGGELLLNINYQHVLFSLNIKVGKGPTQRLWDLEEAPLDPAGDPDSVGGANS